MTAQHAEGWSRRAFLSGLTLAGTSGLLGLHSRLVAAELPPETTRRPSTTFYYPYASLIEEQSVLLKAAALYFDKLYILDPMKARFKRIRIKEVEQDMLLLEREGLLKRLAPEEVLYKYEPTITAAIQRDLSDEEFKRLCAEKGGSVWTLALAKVPEHLRQDPAFQPLEKSMARVLSLKGTVYDEDGRDSRLLDYRYADYPFEIGEAIMLNHALVGSFLQAGAIPITDDEVHSSILNYKIRQAQQQVPEIRDIVAGRQALLKIASAKLAAQALTDLDLGVIPDDMPLEDILDYRRRYAGELQAARDEMQWLAREITLQPWTQEFEAEVFHKAIAKLHKALGPAQSSWSTWPKLTKYGVAGVAVVVGMFAAPLTPIPLTVAALNFTKEVLDGLEDYQEWKQGKTQNGFHYLLQLKHRSTAR